MLWISWLNIVWKLRPAFSREITFSWGVMAIISFSVRQDLAGVTSFIRSSWLKPKYYQRLIDSFHSKGIKLDLLVKNWTMICLDIFSKFLIMKNKRIILVLDGLKIGKEGRKMPGVKSLYQGSSNNSKPEYIMGHSYQAISILVKRFESILAVPLISRIHEGFKLSNRDRKTLLDKAISLLDILDIQRPFYLLADAYYAAKKVAQGTLDRNGHIVTRVKISAIAWRPAAKATKRGRGRPQKYGKKIKLRNYFSNIRAFTNIESPVYGEKGVIIKVRTLDLLWRGIGRMARYVLVSHPTRGRMIVMSTDLSLDAREIVELYGLRFKIEVSFKSAIHTIGAYSYRFWMSSMKKVRLGDGKQYLHRESEKYREKYLSKIKAYEVHVQFGLIAQGMMQYLAVKYPEEIWRSFGSWIRTIRPGILPSEMVVGMALRPGLLNLLGGKIQRPKFEKFIAERVDITRVSEFRATG